MKKYSIMNSTLDITLLVLNTWNFVYSKEIVIAHAWCYLNIGALTKSRKLHLVQQTHFFYYLKANQLINNESNLSFGQASSLSKAQFHFYSSSKDKRIHPLPSTLHPPPSTLHPLCPTFSATHG